MKYGGLAIIGAGSLIWAGGALAQSVISVRSGLINYVEGKVLLDGKDVGVKFDSFPQIRNGSELRTEEGRAEVLLGPGVFMRLGEHSAVRMTSDEIMHTRLEFLAGSLFLESADLAKGQAITVSYKTALIGVDKKGLYRIDADPASLSVYDGEARVVRGGQIETVKRSHRLALDGLAVAEKFDNKTGDALFRWARRRAEYLAVANVSAARQAEQFGFWGSSNEWTWNPYFGTYTFLPMGVYDNYWGYRFWSPASVYMLYMPGMGAWYPGSTNSGLRTTTSAVTAAASTSTASGMTGGMQGRSLSNGGFSTAGPVGRGGATGHGR